MRCIPLMALTTLLLATPAAASEPLIPAASASYNPWLAAGLTLTSIPVGAAVGTQFAQRPIEFGPTVLAIPLISTGHWYAGDPMRGLAFSAGNAGMFLATAASYVYLYGGRSFRYSETPPWQAGVANNIVTGYLVTSVLYTTWAAWDAYRIAEERNRMEPQAGRLGN